MTSPPRARPTRRASAASSARSFAAVKSATIDDEDALGAPSTTTEAPHARRTVRRAAAEAGAPDDGALRRAPATSRRRREWSRATLPPSSSAASRDARARALSVPHRRPSGRRRTPPPSPPPAAPRRSRSGRPRELLGEHPRGVGEPSRLFRATDPPRFSLGSPPRAPQPPPSPRRRRDISRGPRAPRTPPERPRAKPPLVRPRAKPRSAARVFSARSPRARFFRLVPRHRASASRVSAASLCALSVRASARAFALALRSRSFLSSASSAWGALEHRRARADRSRRLRLLRRPRALRLRLSRFVGRLLASGLGERVRVRELARRLHTVALAAFSLRAVAVSACPPWTRDERAPPPARAPPPRRWSRACRRANAPRELGLQRPNARVQTRALAPRLRLESLRFRRRVLEAGPRGPRASDASVSAFLRSASTGTERHVAKARARPSRARRVAHRRSVASFFVRAAFSSSLNAAHLANARETDRLASLRSAIANTSRRLFSTASSAPRIPRRARAPRSPRSGRARPGGRAVVKNAAQRTRFRTRDAAFARTRLRRPASEVASAQVANAACRRARGDSARHLGAHGAKPRRFVHALDPVANAALAPRDRRPRRAALAPTARSLLKSSTRSIQVANAPETARRASRPATRLRSASLVLAPLVASAQVVNAPATVRECIFAAAFLSLRRSEPRRDALSRHAANAPPFARSLNRPTARASLDRALSALAHRVAPRRHRPRAPPVAHFPGDPTHRRASRFTLGERLAPRLQRGRRPSREHPPRRAQHEPLAPLLVGFALDAPAAVVQRSRAACAPPGGERATSAACEPSGGSPARRPESPRVLDAPRPRREGARDRALFANRDATRVSNALSLLASAAASLLSLSYAACSLSCLSLSRRGASAPFLVAPPPSSRPTSRTRRGASCSRTARRRGEALSARLATPRPPPPISRTRRTRFGARRVGSRA